MNRSTPFLTPKADPFERSRLNKPISEDRVDGLLGVVDGDFHVQVIQYHRTFLCGDGQSKFLGVLSASHSCLRTLNRERFFYGRPGCAEERICVRSSHFRRCMVETTHSFL